MGAVAITGYGLWLGIAPGSLAAWCVEAGMIGAFLAFGVSAHLAVLAVLAYRTISYWLPTIPGAVAYWRLVRQFNQPPDERSPCAVAILESA